MIKRKESFCVVAVTPASGEPVTRRELADYIREALRNHWTWGKRMKWSVKPQAEPQGGGDG